MTPPVTVTPAEWTAVGDALTRAGAAVEESLGLSVDPAMWTVSATDKTFFGPATDVADAYAALVLTMPDYVRAASGRLAEGGDAFRAAAALFARTEADNAARMAVGPP